MRLNLQAIFTAATIISGTICVCILSEWFVYYIVLIQCDWPKLDPKNEDSSIKSTNEPPLRVMFLTDLHLLGPSEELILEKFRVEWEMYTAFQTAMNLHVPDVVFVLGDVTNVGENCSNDEFIEYIRRFYSTFAVPESTKMHVLVGNHDIGFHYSVKPYLVRRFELGFNSPAAQLITIRGNHFVLVNSIGLEGDGCFLCNSTENELQKIEKKLRCSKEKLACDLEEPLLFYSKPILLQHFPLYRKSDENCHEPDEAPPSIKTDKFKEAWDCLSKKATEKLLKQIEPRFVIDGHTHHGCTTKLPNAQGVEITLSSFSWRNKDNPSYGLAVFSSNNWSFSKCLMPKQSTALKRYFLGFCCALFGALYWFGILRRRRRTRFFMDVL